MKFIAISDWSYLFTLYTDLNFFYMRKLYASVDNFGANYSSPYQVNTP